MTLDDIRRLNIREAGSWPLLPKAVVLTLILAVIVIVGALLDWRDQLETLDRVQAEEGKLKEAYASKKAKAVNLELYIQQLRKDIRAQATYLDPIAVDCFCESYAWATNSIRASHCNSHGKTRGRGCRPRADKSDARGAWRLN